MAVLAMARVDRKPRPKPPPARLAPMGICKQTRKVQAKTVNKSTTIQRIPIIAQTAVSPLPRTSAMVTRQQARKIQEITVDKSTTNQGEVIQIDQIPVPLRKLPPELRNMVFTAYFEPVVGPFSRDKDRELALSHIGTTPALLIAIRRDSELYQEALAVYYQMNSFAITKRNFKRIPLLSATVFPLVQSVVVEIDGISSKRYTHRYTHPDRLFQGSLLIKPKRKQYALAKVTGLTSLTFQCNVVSIGFVTAIVAQQLTLVPSLTEIKCIILMKEKLDNIVFRYGREEMNKVTNVTGVETQGSLVDLKIAGDKILDAVEWVWTLPAKKLTAKESTAM